MVTFFLEIGGDSGATTPAVEEETPAGSFPAWCLGDTKDTGGSDATCTTFSSPPHDRWTPHDTPRTS